MFVNRTRSLAWMVTLALHGLAGYFVGSSTRGKPSDVAGQRLMATLIDENKTFVAPTSTAIASDPLQKNVEASIDTVLQRVRVAEASKLSPHMPVESKPEVVKAPVSAEA